ncbi:RNA polymerase subunit sigma-70 [Streptomyces sp. NPDC003327]
MHDDTFATALTSRFDADRERLRGMALYVLGSREEAEAVLAEARADIGRGGGAATVRSWLAASVGLACVRRLQERAARGSRAGAKRGAAGAGRGAAGLPPVGVDAVWLALLVVLESLEPAERLAYVAHDLFGLPDDEAARITGRPPEETARIARRVRERLRGGGASRPADATSGRERRVVERFLVAVRTRDARGLAAVLDPALVVRTARGAVHGAPAGAECAAALARLADTSRAALIGGAVGVVGFTAGRPVSAMACTLRGDRIVTLDVVTGEDRVAALDLTFPDG